jgi:hypothetical protein
MRPNKGKHLKGIVGLCYIALRPWAPDTQPLWDSKVSENVRKTAVSQNQRPPLVLAFLNFKRKLY